MNVEKLNSLAFDIVEENNKLKSLALFQNVINTLQNIITQPQQPQFQTTLSNQLLALKDALSKSFINDLSPAWYQVLIELDIDDVFGNKLGDTISKIFSQNQITPATAKQELDLLFNKLNNKISGFTNLIDGLSKLEIGFDILDEGVCEIGVLIPRDFIENDLGKFGKEINDLNFIFNNYSELITGKKQSFQIRNLSTSEPLVTIATITAIAAGIAKTIGWLIDNYKKLLEIKKLKAELVKQGVSDKNLQGIQDHSNDYMKIAIEKIIEKIEAEYQGNGDGKRKNELINGVRISLNKIANRIDRGFNFEVRIASTNNQKNKDEHIVEIKEIQKASEKLQFMKTEGEPILMLPEKKE